MRLVDIEIYLSSVLVVVALARPVDPRRQSSSLRHSVPTPPSLGPPPSALRPPRLPTRRLDLAPSTSPLLSLQHVRAQAHHESQITQHNKAEDARRRAEWGEQLASVTAASSSSAVDAVPLLFRVAAASSGEEKRGTHSDSSRCLLQSSCSRDSID